MATPGINKTTAGLIDQLMDRASEALVGTNYFEAEVLSLRALAQARRANDFERMARICLPLQEARRQRRQIACDVSGCSIVTELPARGERLKGGRYLVSPPLVGKDGRVLREMCERQAVSVMVLVREPQNRAGKWPIVGVGTGPREPIVVRAYVDPPGTACLQCALEASEAGAQGLNGSVTSSAVKMLKSSDEDQISLAWYLLAHEALGDAAIAKAPQDVPADHHVDDLLDSLEAVPDHEKLVQALSQACRAAAGAPISELPRRRPLLQDAWSF